MAKKKSSLTAQEKLKADQKQLKKDQKKLKADQETVKKLGSVAVHTESRERPKYPPTLNVAGNTLKVDQNTGKVIGESDPKKIRARVLERNRQKRLGPAGGTIGIELPQVD